MTIQAVSTQSVPVSTFAPVEVVPKVVSDSSAVVAVTPAKPPTTQQLEKAVGQVNRAMQQASIGLQFSIDASTKRPIVSMVDSSNGRVIRQYPSEEVLAISHSIDQFLQHQGLLLKQSA